MNQEHKIVLYQVEDTNIYVNVMFKEDTFWMTQKAMAEQLSFSTITIKRMLTRLQRNGKVKREGSSRRGKWIVL